MKKQWLYLQRKNPMAPLPGYYNISVVFMDLLPKIIPGATGKEWVALYENNVCTVYGIKSYFDVLFRKVLRFILRNPKFVVTIKKQLLRKSKQFLFFCKALPSKPSLLSALSNEKLLSLFKKYISSYQNTYIYGEPLAWILKDTLPEFLLKYLDTKREQISQGRTKDDVLGILITNDHLSFVLREEFDSLKLAKIIKQNKGWHILFKHSVNKILKTIESDRKLKQLNFLLDLHTKKWSWIPYDYGVMVWDKKHFISELRNKILLADSDIDRKIKQFSMHTENIIKQQKDIYNDISIDAYYQSLFNALKDCAFLLDYKKEIFTKSHIYIRPLLEEIARRLGLSYNNFCYLLPEEVGRYLSRGEISSVEKEQINNRFKFSVLYSRYPKKHIMLQGRKAHNLSNMVLRSINEQERKLAKSEIKGQIAMKGVVKGRIRVILDARKIHEFRDGEILVTKMTSPDYTVGLKKAAGIVTDEGGITCHAAIVSRELGIPCIIGTKISTKVLKNGDLVRVDANKGIVEILKKAK